MEGVAGVLVRYVDERKETRHRRGAAILILLSGNVTFLAGSQRRQSAILC